MTKRTDWDTVLATPEMKKAAINFAIGTLFGSTFKELGVLCGCGPETCRLVRSRGARLARQAARKALKRRALLTEQNLVDPLVYAQL